MWRLALAAAVALGACSGPDASSASLVVRFPIQAVAPGAELSGEVAGTLPTDRPVWIQRIDWLAPAGLHHSRLDAPPDASGHFYPIMALPVGVSTGAAVFPPGYAVPMTAHQPLNVSYHFLNTGSEPITGAIEVRFTLAAAEPPPTPISMLALFDNAIELPPHAETVVETTCPLPDHAILIHSLASHTHRLGIGVDVVVVGGAHDGERIYTTTAWSDAPVVVFAPPLALESGALLRFTCHYRNSTDAVVRYGAGASDEMCGVVANYSPGTGPWGALVGSAGQPCVAGIR